MISDKEYRAEQIAREAERRLAMLPCPFCGGEAHTIEPARYGKSWGVRCECGAFLGFEFTEAEAIEAWNTRYDTEYGAVPATEENMAKHGWYRRETCHDVRTDYKILFECSDCGWSCADTYACDEIAFCPGCGRKVSA